MFKDPDGNILLEGDDIKDAKYSEDATDSTGLPSPHVVLEFSDSGSKNLLKQQKISWPSYVYIFG